MLKDTHIRQAKPRDKAYRLFDSHGLYLQVQPNGSRLWRYKYRIAGRENVYAIGAYPEMSLKAARDEHAAARECVRRGEHPAENRRQRKAALTIATTPAKNPFKNYAEQWIKKTSIAKQWSSRYLKDVINGIGNDLIPEIGHMDMPEINSLDLLRAIRKIEARGAAVVAINVRQWASAIFCSAILEGLCKFDPAAALSKAIIRPPIRNATAHDRKKIGEILDRVDSYQGSLITRRAIKFLAYTFGRTVEIRRAEWSEFDLENALWVIPAHKMKKRRIHLVPLSQQAVTLIKSMKEEMGNKAYVFHGIKNSSGMLNHMTINHAFKHMGYGVGEVTGHDFRATASTMLYEAGYREEVVEFQLSHVEANKTKRAYNHAKYLDERKAMMQWYADQLDACVAKYRETQEQKATQASEAPALMQAA